jgi:hypothetical protein
MLAFELAPDFAAKARLPEGKIPSLFLVEALHTAGLLSVPSGTSAVRWLPPLNVTRAEIDEATHILRSVHHYLESHGVKLCLDAEVAERLKLDEAIYLSLGESERGGARRPAALAAVLEALIGAIYLSLGFAAAAAFVQAQLAPEIATPRALLGKGIKTMLQEWTQARNGSLPRYDIVATSGPEHDRIYECVVRVDGGEVARGSGPSRRAAEAAAAEAAIDILGVTAGASA